MARKRSVAELKRSPAHVTAAELLRVLRAAGWQARGRTKHGTIVRRGDRTFLVPRPHGSHLLPVYVRKVVKILEEES